MDLFKSISEFFLSTPFWEFHAQRPAVAVVQHKRSFLLPFGSFEILDELAKKIKIVYILSTPFWEFRDYAYEDIKEFIILSTPFWEFLMR